MARSIDYNKRIADIDKKLAANKEAARKLIEERDRLLSEKKNAEMQVVLDRMEEQGMSVDDLLSLVKNAKK